MLELGPGVSFPPAILGWATWKALGIVEGAPWRAGGRETKEAGVWKSPGAYFCPEHEITEDFLNHG